MVLGTGSREAGAAGVASPLKRLFGCKSEAAPSVTPVETTEPADGRSSKIRIVGEKSELMIGVKVFLISEMLRV